VVSKTIGQGRHHFCFPGGGDASAGLPHTAAVTSLIRMFGSDAVTLVNQLAHLLG
jgi:hypothetical protein